MKIEFKIRYLEVIKAYFYNLRHSRRTQNTLLGAVVLIAIFVLWMTYRTQGFLAPLDYVTALLTGLSLLILIPAASVFASISQKRIITISPQGIVTNTIGPTAKMAWKTIESILATDDLILITSKNVNVLSIPARAFESNKQRKEFIFLANQYFKSAKNKSASRSK